MNRALQSDPRFADPAPAGAPEPATFYFEYASPYSYLATRLIDEVAGRHGREVRWRPIRLGDVLRRQGIAVDAPPAKVAYIARDARRCAKLHGLAFVVPARFPPDAALARRAFYWLDTHDPALARGFAHAVAGLYYGAGRDISTADDLAPVAEMLGVGRVGLAAALGDPGAERRLEEANAEAAALGCFGVPWFHADGESFFGHDRLPHLGRLLGIGAGGPDRGGTARHTRSGSKEPCPARPT